MLRLFARTPRTLSVAACASCLLGSASTSGRTESAATSGDVRVNTVTERIQQSSAVAMDARGNFVVAWQSELDGSVDDVRARRFDARGRARGDEFLVNTVTEGNQHAPALAMDAQGAFVVVWQSYVINRYVIRARCFDAQGLPRGGEIAVDTRPRQSHNAPAVAMAPDGRFVVAWESAIQGSYEIRARRFDAQGVAQGGEISVNTVKEHSQRFPAVATDAHGNFVVVWRSNVAGSFEIRAQRFAASGSPEGGEIVVNADTLGDQLAPSVAMDSDGEFIVAWENSLGDLLEIRARRFSSRGVARGLEFPANAATAGNQYAPAVAMNPRGDAIIVWHSHVGASAEIRGRAFASNGSTLGQEIAVNTFTSGTQKSAAVALDPMGDFVAAWHSDASGNWDVVARRARIQLEPRTPFRRDAATEASSNAISVRPR